MSLSEYEITLQEALQAAGLTALPKKITPSYNKKWIKAICLVTKVVGCRGFCLCESDSDGNCIIKRDFGTIATIASIDEIYPYQELDSRFVPNLRNDSQVIQYLVKAGHNEAEITALLSKENKIPECVNADQTKVKKLINEAAMEFAKKILAEEARVAKIKKHATTRRKKESD